MTVLSSTLSVLVVATLLSAVAAQDPAGGWITYAVGSVPAGTQRITSFDAQWRVPGPQSPQWSSAFYSPWFGMDPADNLNLIQPVNPWMGNGWVAYTEYFQWSPEYNSNSPQIDAQPGDLLKGKLTYQNSSDGYILSQTNTRTGQTSHQYVQAQNGKKYVVPYVVFEKIFPCYTYPPSGSVVFEITALECDYSDCMKQVQWKTAMGPGVTNHCDFQTHINAANNISITWNTQGPSQVDGLSDRELFDINYHGWAKKFNLKRP